MVVHEVVHPLRRRLRIHPVVLLLLVVLEHELLLLRHLHMLQLLHLVILVMVQLVHLVRNTK